VGKMIDNKKKEETSEQAFKPLNALDCVNQDNFTESKANKGFGNDSKNINHINTTYSHSAIDICIKMI